MRRRASREKNYREICTRFCAARKRALRRWGAYHYRYHHHHRRRRCCGFGCGSGRQNRLCRLLGRVVELDPSGLISAGFVDPGSGLCVRSGFCFNLGREGRSERLPRSSAPSSQSASHFPRSRGMPHSASTIIGRSISFVAASRNSGRVYRLGSVGMSRSFGGHGGAGSGFWYRTLTRRSSLLCVHG